MRGFPFPPFFNSLLATTLHDGAKPEIGALDQNQSTTALHLGHGHQPLAREEYNISHDVHSGSVEIPRHPQIPNLLLLPYKNLTHHDESLSKHPLTFRLHSSHSDPLIMQQTVRLCAQHSIAIGAHPGLPDIQGFGRREIKMSPEELTAMTRYQVGALKAFLDAEGLPLHHVKPHGVLYGMMYRDAEVCRAVYAGVPKGVPVFGLAGTVHEQVAREMGLPFVAELYGDVKYNKDGTLVIDRKKK